MDIIDEEGRLFGLVNVVDALVVLLAAGVVVAGVALVNPFGPEEEEEGATRFATVEFGPQPAYVADEVSVGDAVPDPEGNLTLTDVYRAPADGGKVAVTARVRLEGAMVPNERLGREVFSFRGTHLRPGDELSISTADFGVTGQVTSVERDGPSLDAEWTPVVLRGTVPDGTGSVGVEAGGTHSAAGREFLRVSRVEAYPAGAEEARLVIGGELLTLGSSGDRSFAAADLVRGAELDLGLGDRRFNGEVMRLGTDRLPGEPGEARAEVEVSGVEPAVAGALEPGLTETFGGETLVEVTASRSGPAEVTHVSDTGEVVESTHPGKRDVELDATLSVRRTDRALHFRGEPLRVGDRVSFDFGTVTVTGTVTSLEE